MRTKLSVLAAVVALAFAGSAKADSISLIWQGTGTDVTSAASSSTITADIVLSITSTNIAAVGWNISWDDELTFVGSTLVAGATLPHPGTNWGNFSSLGAAGSNPGPNGTHRVYQYTGSGNMTVATATVGTIMFHVTGNVNSDGAPVAVAGNTGGPTPISGDVSADFINTNNGVACFLTGGGYCSGNVTINGASVNLIPEPGTVALLTLGLTGLGLVGRRSRS